MTHYLDADDTQIYFSKDTGILSLFCVQEWIIGVKLKLNPDKTKFIIIVVKHTRESLKPNFLILFLHSSISSAVEVKNLGVTFVQENTFDNHTAKVCHACYYHFRDLQHICEFLTVDTAVLVANTMVSSRLDNCKSLLYGISKVNVANLQTVQNALCHIVFRLDKSGHNQSSKILLASHFILYPFEI